MSLQSVLTSFLAVGHNEKQNTSRTLMERGGKMFIITKKIPNLPYEMMAMILEDDIQKEKEEEERKKNEEEHKKTMKYVLGQLSYTRCVHLIQCLEDDYEDDAEAMLDYGAEPYFVDFISEAFYVGGEEVLWQLGDVMPPNETRMICFGRWLELGLNEKFCVCMYDEFEGAVETVARGVFDGVEYEGFIDEDPPPPYEE